MNRVFMFAIIPAIVVGPGLVGLNSVVAQNMTPGGMMAGSAKMHLEEGIKAIESGNIQAANMHLDFARQAMANSPTNAVKHFEEGMKALGAGDSNGALMHLKLADQALG